MAVISPLKEIKGKNRKRIRWVGVSADTFEPILNMSVPMVNMSITSTTGTIKLFGSLDKTNWSEIMEISEGVTKSFRTSAMSYKVTAVSSGSIDVSFNYEIINVRRKSSGRNFYENLLASFTREDNVPPLITDFGSGIYGINGVSKTLIDVVPNFTRASVGTYIDSTGSLVTAAIDEIRIDHDPSTFERLGILVEPAAINLISSPSSPSTQTISVSDATEYTLHFSGSGTLTLTGASTAGPLVGTGTGEANRVSLTFTTGSTSLTITVSGTVANAQLETGGMLSSFIDGTRAKDVASIPTSDFGYDALGGTLIVEHVMPHGIDATSFICSLRSASNKYIRLSQSVTANVTAKTVNISTQASIFKLGSASGKSRTATAFYENDFTLSVNGLAVAVDAAGTIPVISTMYYGADQNGFLSRPMRLKSVVYHDTRLTDTELVLASTI